MPFCVIMSPGGRWSSEKHPCTLGLCFLGRVRCAVLQASSQSPTFRTSRAVQAVVGIVLVTQTFMFSQHLKFTPLPGFKTIIIGPLFLIWFVLNQERASFCLCLKSLKSLLPRKAQEQGNVVTSYKEKKRGEEI